MVSRILLSPLRLALIQFRKFLLRLDRHSSVEGFEVSVTSLDEHERNQSVAKICETLRLIKLHTPVAFNRLRGGFRYIWVRRLHRARGQYERSLNACSIDIGYLLDAQVTPMRLAMTVVHEGTHAHLIHLGFRYRESERARIERLCVKSEVILAKRMHAPKSLLREATQRLQRGPTFYTDTQNKQMAVQRLMELGAPHWLVELFDKWFH